MIFKGSGVELGTFFWCFCNVFFKIFVWSSWNRFLIRFWNDLGSQNVTKMHPNWEEKFSGLKSRSPFFASKNALRKRLRFLIVFRSLWGSPWPPFGPSWDHFGRPQALQKSQIWLQCSPRISKNPLQIRRESTKNLQEPAAHPPRFCREPPRTHRMPSNKPPKTYNNPQRTRSTNSKQKPISQKDLCEGPPPPTNAATKAPRTKVGRRYSPL